MHNLPELTDEERDRYGWQLTVPGFGEEGQCRLKSATVLVSRIGGVGGTAAMQLAAAGVGRLLLAHAGPLRRNDLNRQMLMSTEGIGSQRVEVAARRLREINPNVQLQLVAENISEENAARLVSECDLIVGAVPLFTERLLLNREAVRQRKPMIDCVMYELEGRLTTIVPGKTPCLACLYPESPPHWKREFPVLSAVSSTVGSLAAMEAIKQIAGLGEPLHGRLLTFDLRDQSYHTVRIERRAECEVCGTVLLQ